MSVFSHLRRIWWRLPAGLRAFGPLARLKSQVKSGMATHDDIYTPAYYMERRQGARQSARIIAQSLVETFHPRDVLDVGSGTGDLVQALLALGVNASGLEYSDAALAICRRENIPVQKFDLEKDQLPSDVRAEIITSAEVAEHLPASCADRYVDLLARATRGVVFTAAIPGQGGTDHVNEQPHAYWIEKFNARGFELDLVTTTHWRDDWQRQGILDHYHKNLMIFRRRI
ncbi:MAG TPA: class I SAM-dependent methyltransferase [Tepidisphaeraceae bacterium]|jgi:SAM-dependent methyltransferase